MNAFGFTDSQTPAGGNGDESLFSFTDGPVEDSGDVSEFSFGQAEEATAASAIGTTGAPGGGGPSLFAAVKTTAKPAANGNNDLFDGTDKAANQGKKPVKKKATSRVIGQKKSATSKAKAPKLSKFAKKDGTSQSSGQLGLFSKSSKSSSSQQQQQMSSEVADSDNQPMSESDNPFGGHDSNEYASSDANAEHHSHQSTDLESLLARQEPPQFYTSEMPPTSNSTAQKSPQSNQPEDESAFDFGAAEVDDNNNNNSFSFNAENNNENNQLNGDNDNNESGFSFGQSNEASPQPSSSPFDDNTTSFNNNQKNMKYSNNFKGNSAAASIVANVVEEQQQAEQFDADFTEDCKTFVRSLARLSKDLEGAQASYDKCQKSLAEYEQQQSEALRNEQFDVADQLNTQIGKMKTQMLMSQSGYNKTIADAMTLTNEAPQHFLSHAAAAQTELPTLRVRKQALDKRLSNLKEDQLVDKQTIEIERKKNSSLIESLKKPIAAHSTAHDQMEIELQANIENAKQPFVDALDDLEKQKTIHEDRIEELKREILLHQNEIDDIKKKIVSNQKQMKATVDSFDNDRQNVIEDKSQLEREGDELTQKIREIEAPFQSLVDTVEKRETEINGVSTAIEKIAQQIDDGEKDSNGCESAASIVNKLCQDHFKYSELRNDARNRFDASLKSAKESEARRNQINDEAIELRGRLQRASEYLSNAKLKIPQLEASKKAAVSSKNFKGAQQINKELNAMNEQAATNEKLVQDGTQQLEKLEAEASGLTESIAKASIEVEESKISLMELDHSFFSNAAEVINKLVEISPFGEKLLRPLVKMVNFALEHAEVPKQSSPDEIQEEITNLNSELEKAINDEDFDAAEAINKTLESLKAKLQFCKSREEGEGTA